MSADEIRERVAKYLQDVKSDEKKPVLYTFHYGGGFDCCAMDLIDDHDEFDDIEIERDNPRLIELVRERGEETGLKIRMVPIAHTVRVHEYDGKEIIRSSLDCSDFVKQVIQCEDLDPDEIVRLCRLLYAAK